MDPGSGVKPKIHQSGWLILRMFEPPEEEAAAIIEEDAEDMSNFVIPGGVCHNWVAVDVPTIIQLRLKNPATVKLGHYKCNVKKKREKRVKNQSKID
ncbi:hypothetical protein KIW84_053983 [Lathyrus oleraceus]|uniref:Uncharacterized protein n=1 Tax=Pisum sativum TaxID=3888 RepID=A0A9D4WUE9_PEA|nr:hypothetical protein KIW84_053983 [Pisum sativum]